MTVDKQISSFWKEMPFRSYFYVATGLGLFTILAVLAVQNFLTPVVPLFYGRPEGQGQLIPKLGLLIAPVVAIGLSLINTVVAAIAKDNFIQKVLVISTFLISILTTITVLKIIFLVAIF